MTQRDRIVLVVLASVALLAGFYMAVLKPQRAELAELDGQLATQQQRRDGAAQKVAQGEQARRRYAEDYEAIVRLGRAVPVDDQVPSLVFGLESTGKRHAVDLRGLKLRASGAAPAAPAAAPAPATTSSSGTASAGSTAAAPASGVPATQAAAATAPPGSAVGSAGFPTLPFDFEFESDFFRFERFLSAVERYSSIRGGRNGDVDVRGRLITIDGFGLKASKLEGFPRVSATLSATTYVDPEGAKALAGASPAGPAAAAGGTTAGAAPAPAAAPGTTTATVRGVTP